MELVLKDSQNTLIVSEAIFGCNFNESLVHQIITSYAAGIRQGTKAQKSRSEVAGSGKKPWRQKRTGRARAGSFQSPIWRSGGITFAAKTRSYNQKVNKKMYRGAIKSILSELVRQERLIVVKQFYIELPKTKLLVLTLKNMFLDDVLIITNNLDKNLLLASRNLYKVEVRSVQNINPISLITFNKVIMTVEAIKQIENMLI